MVEISYTFYDNNNNQIILELSKKNILIIAGKFKKFPDINNAILSSYIGANITKLVKLPKNFYIPNFQNHLVLIKIDIHAIKNKTTNLSTFSYINIIHSKIKVINFLKSEVLALEEKHLYKQIINFIYYHTNFLVPKNLIKIHTYNFVKNNQNLLNITYHTSSIQMKIIMKVIQQLREYLIISLILNNYKEDINNLNYYLKNSNKQDIIKKYNFICNYHITKNYPSIYSIFKFISINNI